MESLNRMAIELVDEALDYAEELNIGAMTSRTNRRYSTSASSSTAVSRPGSC